MKKWRFRSLKYINMFSNFSKKDLDLYMLVLVSVLPDIVIDFGLFVFIKNQKQKPKKRNLLWQRRMARVQSGTRNSRV